MKIESHLLSKGYNPEWSEGSVKSPIFMSSTFVFRNAQEGKRFFEIAYGKVTQEPTEQLGLIYSRLNNPNMQILEERLALVEETEDAAVFESGMAAISTVMLTHLRPGDVLLFSNPIYGGTHHFIHHFLTSIGVEVRSIGVQETSDEIMERLRNEGLCERVKMIYVETPANPTNALFDLADLGRLKSILQLECEHPIFYVVDNTYLGPIWQKPMQFGADIVCYSATKFLNGHSDIIAGAVMGSAANIAAVKGLRTFLGSMMSPHTAWVLTRSLETLYLRMNRQGENARKVYEFLKDQPTINRVLFPGESTDARQRRIYDEQCLGAGAMISFEVKGGEAAAFAVLDALKMIKLAVSLGSNESLAQHPFTMTHADVPDDEKNALGLTEGLIRLSVGIEHPDDIIEDLRQALSMIK